MNKDDIELFNNLINIDNDAVDSINKIINLIKTRYHLDLAQYKNSTIIRRVDRRMKMCNISSYDMYLKILLSNNNEVESLYKDMFIGVTEFFRDSDAFEYLEKFIIPNIFEQSSEKDVRIWVPACSTGEEVYSLAIIIMEYLEKKHIDRKVYIFATDIDKNTIIYASKGKYPKQKLENISCERKTKYFQQIGEYYHIKKSIRKMIHFSQHDLLYDHPFNRLNLISCRNLLIYLKNQSQQKLISMFHYSLQTGGFLFLGSSETIGDMNKLFDVTNKKYKFYKARIVQEKMHYYDFNYNYKNQKFDYIKMNYRNILSNKLNNDSRILLNSIKEALIKKIAPSYIIINDDNEIIDSRGEINQFLKVFISKTSYNIFEIFDAKTVIVLKNALNKAKQLNSKVKFENIIITNDEKLITVDMKVIPYCYQNEDVTYHAMLMYKKENIQDKDVDYSSLYESEKIIKELKDELKFTKESLEETVEELYVSNEELQSANEELLLSNEELQSTNEELSSVNTELQMDIEEIERLNNDMDNLIKSTNLGTLFLDKNLCIRKFTPSIQKHFDLNLSDIGRPISSFAVNIIYDGDMIEDAQYAINNCTLVEKEVNAVDGSYYLIRFTPFVTANKSVEGIILTFIDITSLKQTERALKESNLNISTLLNAPSHTYILIDLNEKVLLINKYGAHKLGYEPEQLINTNLFDILPPDVVKVRKTYIEQVKNTLQTVENIDSREDKIFSNYYYPVCNEEGTLLKIAIFAYDITKQKKAEIKSKENEERLQLAIDAADMSLWDWNIKSGEILIGDKCLEITGCTVEKIKTISDLDQFIYSDDLLRVEQNLKKYFKGETQQFFDEIRVKYKDDTYKWIKVQGQVIKRDKNNSPVRMLGIYYDITESKTLKEELLQAEKMQAVGQLAGGVAHDFNNQLMGIIGYSELLIMKLKEIKLKEYAKLINTVAKRSADLTQKLLDFSHKGNFLNVMVKIQDVIIEVIKLLEFSIVKKIVIETNFNAKNDIVKGDPSQMQNAILNLTLNAIDAMSQGGKLTFTTNTVYIDKNEIWVKNRKIKSGEFLNIQISDTGVGMDQELAKHIFEPFFTTKGAGNGMGLAAVLGAVESNEGIIEVTSQLGIGTKFDLYIPLCKEPFKEVAIENEVKRGRGNVLLIDDEEIVRELTAELLKEIGYDVTAFEDGFEGIKFYKNNWRNINLVILDMIMPKISGDEVFRILKGINKEAKVIMLSGYSTNSNIQKLLEQGADAFLQKPIYHAQLSKIVSEIIKR